MEKKQTHQIEEGGKGEKEEGKERREVGKKGERERGGW